MIFHRTYFGPLKTKWRQTLADITSQTGMTLTHGRFFHMFKKTWVASNADNSKLKNGFRCTGIHPFNDKAIPEEANQPSTLYVQESTVTAAVAGNGTNYVNNKFGLFFFINTKG